MIGGGTSTLTRTTGAGAGTTFFSSFGPNAFCNAEINGSPAPAAWNAFVAVVKMPSIGFGAGVVVVVVAGAANGFGSDGNGIGIGMMIGFFNFFAFFKMRAALAIFAALMAFAPRAPMASFALAIFIGAAIRAAAVFTTFACAQIQGEKIITFKIRSQKIEISMKLKPHSYRSQCSSSFNGSNFFGNSTCC